MTYQQVVDTIENKRRFGKACGKEVTEELLELLGHPEEGMKILHIAGTNGKGSTAAFATSILMQQGYSVGTFTSPHLVKFNERIMVQGQQISDEDVTRIGTLLLELTPELEPTMFDYCLAMGLIYFKEKNISHMVLETGLGGAKDSSSGLQTIPEVCAITSIGLEHTAILGDTIEKIAKEKAGIIKPQVKKCVIGSEIPKEALRVIEDRCCELNVDYTIADPVKDDIELGLFGKYQRFNAGVAQRACKAMGVSDDAVILGLKKAVWPGRMQIISREPYVLIDGAHNPNGVEALRDGLIDAFGSKEKYTFLVGVMADKDYHEMMLLMEPLADRFFTLTVDYSRALQAKTLADEINADGIEAIDCTSIEEAMERACCFDNRIIVFGSLYFIGEVIKYFDLKNI
ncbi:MAG: bifunctional folylpolyglutamate synthase/dihydrofolate synthase [Pseudobutyrivibrio sp.]|nr:bifunctional folylpolyglutamate synthase/dihydrofolate synthase [Pseudobutyrivibrio sp.]